MARTCKLCICDESIRKKIETMIESGFSYLKISHYVKKELGFNISHTSIQRHYENHQLGTGNLKQDLRRLPTNTNAVDVDLDKIELNEEGKLRHKKPDCKEPKHRFLLNSFLTSKQPRRSLLYEFSY